LRRSAAPRHDAVVLYYVPKVASSSAVLDAIADQSIPACAGLIAARLDGNACSHDEQYVPLLEIVEEVGKQPLLRHPRTL